MDRGNHREYREEGIALILVVFLITLASVVVINLTYNTQLSSRTHSMVVNGLKAEYLLKSAVNFGRVIIQADTSPEDGPQDPWNLFLDGKPIPDEFLDVPDENVRVSVEIRPEETKVPLRALVPVSKGPPNAKWRDAIARFFSDLGFDQDEEKDHTGLFKDRVFNSKELVAILIDYMDEDTESYSSPDFDATGIESQLTEQNLFPNSRLKRIGELQAIPGFTPNRVRKLTPFVTTFGSSRININIAPKIVLGCLHEELTEDLIQEIIDFRDSVDGPFTPAQQNQQLSSIIGQELYTQLSPLITSQSRWFQILAKVDYGASVYFMRSYVSKVGTGTLPKIRSVELF